MLEDDLVPLDYDPFEAVKPGITSQPDPELVPLDYDPFEQGSYIPEAVKGVAAGAVETAGGILKGLGGIRQEHITQRERTAARAKALEEAGIEQPIYGVPAEMTPETRRIITQATESIPAPDIANDPWFQAGQATQDWSKEQFKAATDFQDSWTRAISSGLGSTLPFMAAGALGPAGSVIVGTGAGMAASSGEAIDRAIQGGASKEQILQALKLGALPGMTEQVPIEVMLERVPLPAVGRFVGVLGKIAAKAMVEGGQEAVQQAMQNVVEKYVYDPKQEIGEGVLESAVIGAAVGGGLGAVTTRNTKRETEDKVDDAPEVSSETQPEGTPAAVTPAGGQPTPGGTGATPPPPVGVDKQPAPPANPMAPTPAQAEPSGQPSPVERPGVQVLQPGTVDVDMAAGLAGVPIAEEEDTYDPAFEDEEGDIEGDTGEDINAEAATVPAPIAGPIPEVRQEVATNAKATVHRTVDDDIAAVMADMNSILKPPSPQAPSAAMVPPPAQVPPQPIPSAPVASAATAAAPTPTAPILTEAPPVAPEVTPPAPDVSLAPAAPVETLAPPPAPEAEIIPEAPLAAAPGPENVQNVQVGPELVPLDHDPFAGEVIPPSREVDLSAVSEDAGDMRKAGAVAKMAEDVLWQDIKAARRPELEEWDRTPEVVRTVAKRLAKEAAKVRGVSPREFLEQRLPAARDEISAARTTFDRDTVAAANEKASKAEATSRQTMEEARKSGAPAELERRGKGKGKSAAALKTQDEKSWKRLEVAEAEKPEADRDPDIERYRKAREARKPTYKIGGSAKERRRLTQEMDEAKASYIRRREEKEAALPPKPPPSTEVSVSRETPPAPKEKSPQEKRNEKTSATLKPAIDEFPVLEGRAFERALITSKDRGKSIIKEFNAALSKALDKEKLGDKPAWGGELTADGKPRPERSPEENLAIFAKGLESRRQMSPYDNISELMAALKFYKAGDVEQLKNMMVGEKIDARQINESTISSVNEEIGYFPEQDMRRKGGSFEPMSVGRKIPEPAPEGETTTVDVTDPETDENVEMQSTRRMTGEQAIRYAMSLSKESETGARDIRDLYRATIGRASTDPWFYGTHGLLGVMNKFIGKHLRTLVGDVDVVFVTGSSMQEVSGDEQWGGSYMGYSDQQLAEGTKPVVLINEDYFQSISDVGKAHVIMHEMAHAATAYALHRNIRGTKSIIARMRTELDKQVRAANGGEMPGHLEYGFKNDQEFVAEAFGNPEFQKLLAAMPVNAETQSYIRTVGVLRGHQLASWWDVFVRAVSRAVAPFLRTGQVSYLEQVVRVSPQMLMTSGEQLQEAEAQIAKEDAIARRLARRRDPGSTSPLQIGPMKVDVQASIDNAALGFRASKGNWSKASLKLQTTENLKRRADQVFGDGAHLFKELADIFLGSGKKRQDYRNEVANAIAPLIKDFHRNRVEFDKAADIVYDATKYQIDPSVPLSHPNNAHITKGGTRDTHRRAAHARLHPKWKALPADVQSHMLDATNALKKQADQVLELTVGTMLDNALRPVADGGLGHTLPAGVSRDDAMKWVMDGGIDRQPGDPANPKPTDQTPADVAMHKALGKTIDSLKGTKEMRRIKGIYAPLMRFGKFYVSARKKIATPAGATRDKEDGRGVHFLFNNKKDLDAYQKAADDIITSVQSEWVDPTTGKKTKKMAMYTNPAGVHVIPVQRFRAIVQNRYMEMVDSRKEAFKLDKDLRAQGYVDVSGPGLVSDFNSNSELLPQHITRLLKSVEQGAGNVNGQGNSASQVNAQGAIISAYIRQLGGQRAQHRRLKRNTVAGHSKDFLRSIHEAGMTTASHLAKLETGPKAAEAERKLLAFINDKQQYGKGARLPRQELYQELKGRMTAIQDRHEMARGDHVVNTIMAASFMKYLASPAYSIFNAIGGQTTTWATLAAKFGPGAVTREQTRAGWDLGAGGITWKGGKEFAKELGNVFGTLPRPNFNYDQEVAHRMVTKEPGFLAVIRKMVELGFGASSGLELGEVNEIGAGRFSRFLNRGQSVARAVPEAIETVNRYVTALTAYRLAKRSGMSEEAAVDYAVTTVERTQGGYAAENNPAYMTHRLWKMPLQFKKYALMYSQLYYGAIARAVGPDPEMRKTARRELAYLSAMTVVLAGTAGLPVMEIAKIFFLAGAMFGFDDGDWEGAENAIQRFFADGYEWVTGDKSNAEFFSEMMNFGLTRAVGLETSSRLGNSSALAYGSPELEKGELDVKSWLFDLLLGAPGGAVVKAGEAIADHDPAKAVSAMMPKMISDIMKAAEKYNEGYVTKSGRKVAPETSIGEAIAQGIGIKPASEARQFEAFGGFAKNRENEKMKLERSRTMGEWANAKPAERARIWREVIQPWNREHRGRDERIEMGDLRRSLARRKSQARKDKRELEAQ